MELRHLRIGGGTTKIFPREVMRKAERQTGDAERVLRVVGKNMLIGN